MSTSKMQLNEMASDIQNFYRNKTVFVTGGTGFMGIVLIEKLLRATEVKRIYLLVRPKRDKSAEERLELLFQSTLFEKLRSTCANPSERIYPILGDCYQKQLGISPENRKILIDEVNVVIHLAATVRFNETLYKAATINVRAVLDLLKLAKEMRQLEAFLHVSSAFANCAQSRIDEKYYSSKLGITAVKMCELCDTLGCETTNKLAVGLCSPYPNTYCFTKSLAEEAVLSEGRTLPISIFRPAIVTQTHNEPISGWIGNLYGPSAALYACGRGVLRVMFMKAHHYSHLVPADYCANLMLAIGLETAKKTPKERLTMAPAIYNYATDYDNPYTWKQYMSNIREYGYEVALSDMIWHPFMLTVSNKWLYILLNFIYHTIPGYMIDTLLALNGQKRRMIDLYTKIYKQIGAMEYFIINEFEFTMDNTQALWNSLSARDKDIFNFDLKTLPWLEYIQHTLVGMRIYLANETPDTLSKAKIKFRVLEVLHRLTQVMIFGTLLYLLWTLLNKIFF